MEDLSLHVLDIVENSIEAGARDIRIHIHEDTEADLLEITIEDDGRGMDAMTVAQVRDPFYTTRQTRRVGLGLSLFQEAARDAGGDLSLHSEEGKGTRVTATFQYGHIDRKPLGDIARTLRTLMLSHPEIRFRFSHFRDGEEENYDTGSMGDGAGKEQRKSSSADDSDVSRNQPHMSEA
jgi:DNA mismatch repair ATPase MutL